MTRLLNRLFSSILIAAFLSGGALLLAPSEASAQYRELRSSGGGGGMNLGARLNRNMDAAAERRQGKAKGKAKAKAKGKKQ